MQQKATFNPTFCLCLLACVVILARPEVVQAQSLGAQASASAGGQVQTWANGFPGYYYNQSNNDVFAADEVGDVAGGSLGSSGSWTSSLAANIHVNNSASQFQFSASGSSDGSTGTTGPPNIGGGLTVGGVGYQLVVAASDPMEYSITIFGSATAASPANASVQLNVNNTGYLVADASGGGPGIVTVTGWIIPPYSVTYQISALTQTNGSYNGGPIVSTVAHANFSMTLTFTPRTWGACCLPGGGCSLEWEFGCDAQGGTYQGDGTACSFPPCVANTGACCLNDGSCQDMVESNCMMQGGVFHGLGNMCAATDCALDFGACCIPGYDCYQLIEPGCAYYGGTFSGPGSNCGPVMCSGVPGDVNDDGSVNVADLLAVINGWGPCPVPTTPCSADLNGDGVVNVTDLLLVINNWGP